MITTVVFDCFGVVYDGGKVNTNVVSLIETLRQTNKYKVGMLSNIDRGTLQKILEDHNLGSLFDVVLASSETDHIKPERQIFEHLAERLGTPFEEWYFVDDLRGNIEAAKSYGIRGHVFTSAEELRQAFAVAGIM